MRIRKLLIANRGEIAVRIMRTAAALEISTVGVAPADDSGSGHTAHADELVELPGTGPGAYLAADELVRIARETGCDAVHPGYGFLSESAEFAEACATAGLLFVGPTDETLSVLGDKTRARELAQASSIPLLPGTVGATSLSEAQQFMSQLADDEHLSAVMVKAVAGGGGRGMAPVRSSDDLPAAFERCGSEGLRAFGSADLYVEALLEGARHLEVQIVGDGTGAVSHLWDRDCSVQRRRQKLVELAPAELPEEIRTRLLAYAVRLGESVNYRGLGTVEFLVRGESCYFLEVNPRIQVEHTVTEELLGIDLVMLQLQIAQGATLEELDVAALVDSLPPRKAMQLRITTDQIQEDGSVVATAGRITALALPSGFGTRVDTYAYVGMDISPRYDSLLAKLIVSQPTRSLETLATRGLSALREVEVAGVQTNASLFTAILRHPEFLTGTATTTFVEDSIKTLLDDAELRSVRTPGRTETGVQQVETIEVPEGADGVTAPMSGVVIEVNAQAGQWVAAGTPLIVIEAMKMEHVIVADHGGEISSVEIAVGDAVAESQVLAIIYVDPRAQAGETETAAVDLDRVRPDLKEVLGRKARTSDDARPDAVAKRRKVGRRTARENVADLLDTDSFVEYGGLVLAAQKQRLDPESLVDRSPADGLVGGIGTVDGHHVMAMSYDYTVFAGTQGFFNHAKMRRMFETAYVQRLPVVMFVEGGGGRPGDTDMAAVAQLDETTFSLVAKLSGTVPVVAIAAGRSFAGNAALASVSDLIIATVDANIGMGGPAMIEGGGLGVFTPEQIGPVDVQTSNGVIDVLVDDDAAAVAAAKTYLGIVLRRTVPNTSGPAGSAEPDATATAAAPAEDQRLLRHVVPENRVRAYDMRKVLALLADRDSLLELRPEFGVGIFTAFARIEGDAVGIIANNPNHLGGAIDAPAAEKAARFLQLCEVHRIPVVSLVDTPGFMVGPDSEETATVRRFGRLFLAGAHMSVPLIAVVLRKGYGLGAMAMCGGDAKAPLATVAWPTGEFGGMGLEGYVRLGYRNELAAIADPQDREAHFQELVDSLYERGKALNVASVHEVDNVIDPADTRRHLSQLLRAAHIPTEPAGRYLDAW